MSLCLAIVACSIGASVQAATCDGANRVLGRIIRLLCRQLQLPHQVLVGSTSVRAPAPVRCHF